MLAVRWIFELARGEGDWKAEMPVDKRARETERNFMVCSGCFRCVGLPGKK